MNEYCPAHRITQDSFDQMSQTVMDSNRTCEEQRWLVVRSYGMAGSFLTALLVLNPINMGPTFFNACNIFSTGAPYEQEICRS